MNNHVYCTECKNIEFNLKCLEENYIVNGEECIKCPCHCCNCSIPEDSMTIEERPKYQKNNEDINVKGLYQKYIIQKADGTPIDPSADYFVLRLDTDKYARGAIRNYANRIYGDNPILSKELRDRCNKYLFDTLMEEGE